jgi:hypothetical protein
MNLARGHVGTLKHEPRSVSPKSSRLGPSPSTPHLTSVTSPSSKTDPITVLLVRSNKISYAQMP